MTVSSRILVRAAALGATLLMLAAAPALGASRYVDDSGSDAVTCTNPSAPCKTVNFAIAAAAPGETVFVGGGSYGAVILNKNVSLVESNFQNDPDTVGNAVIDGAAGTGITATSGTLVQGFTIRGDAGGLSISSSASPTASGNSFDDSAPLSGQLQINGTAAPVISGNTFQGASDGVARRAILIPSSGTPEIAGNTITDFFIGIQATHTDAVLSIHDNQITGIYDQDPGDGIGVGIDLVSSATLTSNLLKSGPGETPTIGLFSSGGGAPTTTVTLRRNRVFGFGQGLEFGSVDGPVTLSGDVSANNGRALQALNASGGVSAQNVTLTDSNPAFGEVYLSDTLLTLDSSIVGPQGFQFGANAACTITFSNGPPGGANGCGNFSSNSTPGFVNPAANDYHLTAASPLIDKGNPAITSGLDLDGQARVIDGNGDCVARADVGADELAAAPNPACTPPPDKTKPLLTLASASPRRFAVDSKGAAETPVAARRKRAKRGTTFAYTLSEAARVVFTVEQKTKGRKVKGTCRKQTRKNRKRRRCTRYRRKGRFAQQGAKGKNAKPFSGKIGSKRLKPGSYRATLVATDAAGNASLPRTVRFRVVRR